MASTKTKITAAAIGVLLIGIVSGCGSGSTGRPLVPVSGTITLDGQPLEGAVVAFRSDREIFTARTDPDGRYALRRGALPGSYKVDVGKRVGGVPGSLGMDPAATVMPGEKLPQSKPTHEVIPARYSNHNQTELAFTVVEPGTDSANFDLTTK